MTELFTGFIVFLFVLAIAGMIELVLRKRAQQREEALYRPTEIKEYEGPRGETRIEEGLLFKPQHVYHQPKEIVKIKPTFRSDEHQGSIRQSPPPRPAPSTLPPPVPPCNRTVHSDDGFLTSMLVAEVTDSAALGYLAGGNLTGAIVGDMLHHTTEPVRYEAPVYEPEPVRTYEAPAYEAPTYDPPDTSSSSCDSSSDW